MLSVPLDLQKEEFPFLPDYQPSTELMPRPQNLRPDPALLDEIAAIIAEAERPILLLPLHDALFLDQVAAAIGRAVEQVAAIDDARLAAELPGGDLVGKHLAERPGVGQLGLRQRDRVRRHIELRAAIAVDE